MTNSTGPILILFMLAIALSIQAVSAVAPEGGPTLVIPSPATNAAPSASETVPSSPSGLAASLPFPVWTLVGVALIIIAAAGFLLLRRPAKYLPKSKRLQK